MNKTTILAIIASTIAVLSILAFSSSEVEAKPVPASICPSENVQHWIYVEFIAGNKIVHTSLPQISLSSAATVTFQKSPDEITKIGADVAEKLNALGYKQENGNPLQSSVVNSVRELGYSTICATP